MLVRIFDGITCMQSRNLTTYGLRDVVWKKVCTGFFFFVNFCNNKQITEMKIKFLDTNNIERI